MARILSNLLQFDLLQIICCNLIYSRKLSVTSEKHLHFLSELLSAFITCWSMLQLLQITNSFSLHLSFSKHYSFSEGVITE